MPRTSRRRSAARGLLGLLMLACVLPGSSASAVPQQMSLVAGGVGDGGPALLASLRDAYKVATDSVGNVYVADSGHHRIRKIATDGTITTVAGKDGYGYDSKDAVASISLLRTPFGIAVDAQDNLIIADTANNRVRQVSTAGTISTIAGTGVAGFSGDGGPATAAKLSSPVDVAVGPDGGIYIADLGNNRVREVLPDGTMTTIAGNGVAGYAGDGGYAVRARIDWAWGVSVGSNGAVYIADTGNQRIRRVAGGKIQTIAGNGGKGFSGDGGAASRAQLYYPWAATPDNAGNVYVADLGNNRIRRVDAQGRITTYAGSVLGYSGDGTDRLHARFALPSGIAFDRSGSMVVADPLNHRVRRISSAGLVSTIAGNGIASPVGDGGLATSASLNLPTDIELGPSGELFVVDAGDFRVRKIARNGVITTVAGKGSRAYTPHAGDGGPAVAAQFGGLCALAIASDGTMYISDTLMNVVRRVDRRGIISTYAGTGTPGFSGDGGAATAARLRSPCGLAIDPHGNVFVTDVGNQRIRRIDARTGRITTVAGNGRIGFAGDGGPASQAVFAFPREISFDPAGNLYVADQQNARIRRIDTAGVITTVAGTTERGYNADGIPATLAQLDNPTDVTVDASGALVISDMLNNRIRVVDRSGIIRTVAGSGVRGSVADGLPALAATMNFPFAAVSDAAGNVYVADTRNNRIHVVEAAIPRVATP